MDYKDLQNINDVYHRLMEKESIEWDELDTYLEILDYLSDDELYRECEVFSANKEIICNNCSSKERCSIPMIVRASRSIILDYMDSNTLSPKNKYILQYYLALNQSGIIIVR